MVIRNHHFFFLFLTLCLFSPRIINIAITAAAASFNVSNFLLSLNIDNQLLPATPPSPSSLFLKDVLKTIALRQNWVLEETRVSDLDVRNARIGSAQKYEFRIRVGKSDLEFQYSDEIDSWRKLRKKQGRFGVLVNEASSKTVLKTFELDGPFELRVSGNDDLSLLLPFNTTYNGIKQVLVGEVAYQTHNPDTYIETRFLPRSTVELLPQKCYDKNPYKKRTCPIGSLSPRLALLEKFLKGVLGKRITQNGVSGFLRAKIIVSTQVRFQLELEKDVKVNDKYWSTLGDWRTKPRTERVRFEVTARVENEKLKPVMVKKVRPFISAESATWSILMSNISFTKFPSVLVPPEALTLDIKW